MHDRVRDELRRDDQRGLSYLTVQTLRVEERVNMVPGLARGSPAGGERHLQVVTSRHNSPEPMIEAIARICARGPEARTRWTTSGRRLTVTGCPGRIALDFPKWPTRPSTTYSSRCVFGVRPSRAPLETSSATDRSAIDARAPR